MKSAKKAVVLLSGGLDSATCLAIAKQQGLVCYALTIAYGQRHIAELNAAKKLASAFQVHEHRILALDLSLFGGSSLTDTTIELPQGDEVKTDEVPNTYVPARNTIFFSLALAYAEVCKADYIYTGITAVDYSGYPDCRPAYLEAFQKMASLATRTTVNSAVDIIYRAPLLYLSKAETIRLGMQYGVDYAMTVSCYQANEQGEACAVCASCQLRRAGFEAAGVADPTHYTDYM